MFRKKIDSHWAQYPIDRFSLCETNLTFHALLIPVVMKISSHQSKDILCLAGFNGGTSSSSNIVRPVDLPRPTQKTTARLDFPSPLYIQV